jgi:glyoxylase-like metal-dependent hydrolase (beta-lactamase superfamily II)
MPRRGAGKRTGRALIRKALVPTDLTEAVFTSLLEGAHAVEPASQLSYEVFVSDPIPLNTDERAPNGDRQMMSPISTTLIVGEREAVLVDPPITTEQTRRVENWVRRSGKRLAHIYSTHGHGDHWFGTALLVRRFPNTSVWAAPGAIDVMRKEAAPEYRKKAWDDWFPGQIPDSPVLAKPPPENKFELEGNTLRIVEVGHTDTDNTTVLHVPSIGLVVAGDAVYNGVHQHLSESGKGGLRAWMKALDVIAALNPRSVVAGHKNKDLPDDPKTIAETRQYLEDAERVIVKSRTAREFFDAMTALYPERLSTTALWWGGQAKPPFP